MAECLEAVMCLEVKELGARLCLGNIFLMHEKMSKTVCNRLKRQARNT